MGASFEIKGKLIKSPGKNQVIEMNVSAEDHYVKIHGNCDNKNYPLAGKHVKPETLRDIAHLRPRTNLIGAVARIRNNLALATHLFFQSRGFLYVHTPIITASDCEGAGEMFQVTTILPDKKNQLMKSRLKRTKKLLITPKIFLRNQRF